MRISFLSTLWVSQWHWQTCRHSWQSLSVLISLGFAITTIFALLYHAQDLLNTLLCWSSLTGRNWLPPRWCPWPRWCSRPRSGSCLCCSDRRWSLSPDTVSTTLTTPGSSWLKTYAWAAHRVTWHLGSLADPDPPLSAEGLDNCKYQTRFGLPPDSGGVDWLK